MKPTLEVIETDALLPFQYKRIAINKFDAPWHFHPEYELTYIIKSSGKRYVGDSIEPFCGGDLILIGSNLPHYWLNTMETHEAECIVIQFMPDYFRKNLFSIPSLAGIKHLLESASCGVKFPVKDSKEIGTQMTEIQDVPPARKFIRLLDILQSLSEIKEILKLSGEGFMTSFTSDSTNTRLKAIQKYIMENFKLKITVEGAASVACLELSAFCRWFKQTTQKTFVEYINELRISYSLRLLHETSLPITEICYESGFTNISNFNLFFKRIKGINPLQYRKMYKPS